MYTLFARFLTVPVPDFKETDASDLSLFDMAYLYWFVIAFYWDIVIFPHLLVSLKLYDLQATDYVKIQIIFLSVSKSFKFIAGNFYWNFTLEMNDLYWNFTLEKNYLY
jgi:hypothetical protein